MIAPHSETAAPTAGNPGDTLRLARESKEWSLSSVAQQLNLSERSLARIEAGDFSQLPGHTFARGYVRAYAKLLGLDQNRLVHEFDVHTGTDASGSSVNSLGHIDEPMRLPRTMVRFFTFALLLIVVGVAFYWWQERAAENETDRSVTALERIEVEAADGTTEIHLLDRPDESADISLQPEQDDNLPVVGGEEIAAVDEPETPPVEAVPNEAPLPEAGQSEPAAENTDASPEQVEESSPTEQAPTVALAPDEARLELQFTEDCWTQITDADGRVLFSALVKAGSSRTVTGKAPLDLHLGYAPGVQVSFNGESVDLTDSIRGQTARLKLGQ